MGAERIYGPYLLFRNRANSNHWLEIDLQGTKSNRDGIGARVLVTAGGKTQLREQNGGCHTKVQNHTRLHFGLGDSEVVEAITVRWPSGIVQELKEIKPDQVLRIAEAGGG